MNKRKSVEEHSETAGNLLDNDSPGKALAKTVDNPDQVVVVKVQGYWWMVSTFVVLIGFIGTTFGWIKALEDKANDVKTAIVKLAPDGSSFVEFHNEDAPIEVWPATINSKLEDAFTRRYRENPKTITSDLTFFSFFLSKEQYNSFVSTNEFDAVGYATDIETDAKRPLVIPELVSMNHMDKNRINVNALTGNDLITTHLYFNFEYRSQKTGLLLRPDSAPDQKIVVVQWRVNPMKLRRKSYPDETTFRAALFENPIGLEILDYKISDVNGGGQ
jgi:hypothetical protein